MIGTVSPSPQLNAGTSPTSARHNARYWAEEASELSAVGQPLAIGLNIVMVEAFSLEPLAWYVIPIGMLALWAVGQLAVAGPARRASNISPALATRSS